MLKSTEIAVWTADFTHNFEGHAVSNVTFKTLVTLTKATVYITIKTAEDKNDREYKRTLVNTVADVEKAFKNLQSNFILRDFMASIIRAMDFEFKFPLLPVSIGCSISLLYL